MDDQQTLDAELELTFWDRHRFLLMVALAIIAAGTLVSIALAVYSSSGAEQLDLSRPGYREAIKNNPVTGDDFTAYPSSGPINTAVMNDFQSQFNKEANNATTVDAFSGDPLNPDTLGLTVDSTN